MFAIDDPAAAVLRALATVSGHYDAAVVLAYLPTDELEALAKSLPEVDLVVGGPTLQTARAAAGWPDDGGRRHQQGQIHGPVSARRERPRADRGSAKSWSWTTDLPMTRGNWRIWNAIAQMLLERDFTAGETSFAPRLPDRLPENYRLAGSAACQTCHEGDCTVWEESKHAAAWATLEGAFFTRRSFLSAVPYDRLRTAGRLCLAGRGCRARRRGLRKLPRTGAVAQPATPDPDNLCGPRPMSAVSRSRKQPGVRLRRLLAADSSWSGIDRAPCDNIARGDRAMKQPIARLPRQSAACLAIAILIVWLAAAVRADEPAATPGQSEYSADRGARPTESAPPDQQRPIQHRPRRVPRRNRVARIGRSVSSVPASCAQADGKPLLVRAGAPWCRWCDKLLEQFETPEVREQMKRWSIVYVDIDDTPGEARQLSIGAIPALRVVNVAGKVVATQEGYLEQDELLAWLKESFDRAALERPEVLLSDKELEPGDVDKLIRLMQSSDPVTREAALRRLMPNPKLAAAPVVEAFIDGKLATRLPALELLTHWQAPVAAIDPWRPETVTRRADQGAASVDRTRGGQADNTAGTATLRRGSAGCQRRDCAAAGGRRRGGRGPDRAVGPLRRGTAAAGARKAEGGRRRSRPRTIAAAAVSPGGERRA